MTNRHARPALTATTPLPPPSAETMARQCALAAEALAFGRTGEAFDLFGDMLGPAFKHLPRPPMLRLLEAALVPGADEYTEHCGDAPPVPADVLVVADLGDMLTVDHAGALNWGAGLGPAGEGRIHRWARVPVPAGAHVA